VNRSIRSRPSLAEPSAAAVASTEEAWRTLGLVAEWIKHAEAKAAGLLAGAGVIAGVLYNLMSNRPHPGMALTVCASACAVFTLLAAVCAATALRPRLDVGGVRPGGLLYFGHIARSEQGRTAYVEAFRALARDQDAMMGEVVGQVWSTARVAWQKYRWGSWGLWNLTLAMVCLAVTGAVAFVEQQ
jgi:hypothetical protein